jgi:acetyl esterase/lipase
VIRLFIAIAFISSFAPSLYAQRTYPPQLEGAEEHIYKKAGDVDLKLYVFEPADHQPSDKRPAIVFFFGGGWANGSPQQFEPQCRYLASRGMVAIAADYRVASRHGVKAVDCVRDAKSAIRWVRAQAQELGIDPERIVAAGGSAGGHIAACTGLVKEFDEPSEEAAVSSRPNALVLFNPVASLDPQLAKQDDPRVKGLANRLGVEPLRISPANHVAADAPPTLVLVGSEDFLIDGVRQFVDQMKAAGVRCELDLYEGRQHGFFNQRGGDNPDFFKTTESMDRFLTSLGYLEGEPTVKEFFKKPKE